METETMAVQWLAERGWTIGLETFEREDRDLREELDAEADTEMGMVLYAESADVRAMCWFARYGVLEEETADVVLEALHRFVGSVAQAGPKWGRGCCPHCSDRPMNPFTHEVVAYETAAWSFPDGSMVVDMADAGRWDVVSPFRPARGRIRTDASLLAVGRVLDMRTHDEIWDEHAAIVGAAGGHARA